jgi:hypothetical protein
MLLSALYIAYEASRYLWAAPADYAFGAQRATYARNGGVMMTHIAAGIVALIAGGVQFLPWLRRSRRLHRVVGTIYVTAVAVGGLAGLRASVFVYGGFSNTLAFGLMSAAWLLATGLALRAIVRGRRTTHGRWMRRSYAITLAAVTLRIELGLLIFAGGLSFAQAYLVVPWTSWLVNLLVLEWWPTTRSP